MTKDSSQSLQSEDKATTRSNSFFRREHGERPVPTPGLASGKIVGDFRLESLIGQGGMGQVWEAEQISLSRRLAVKFVRPERVTEHQLELFAREARAGGRLSHSGIVSVFGYGTSDDLAWIAMELVPGAWDLRNFLDEISRANELPEQYDRRVAKFVAEIADAVHAAHTAGVIHRDLKPQNILITASDKPKVTDFGLARILDESALSITGDFAGTYMYMSPEQVAAKRAGLDHRTDIFSLGIVLYEMLSLVRPFQGDTEHQVAEQILVKDPPDPRSFRSRIPRDLAVIASKALEKDRSKRYGSMEELSLDLHRWLAHKPIHATPPTSLDRAIKWCRRNPTKSIVGGVVCSTTVIIALLLNDNLQAYAALKAKTIEAEQGKLASGELEAQRKEQQLELINQSEEMTYLNQVSEEQNILLNALWDEYFLRTRSITDGLLQPSDVKRIDSWIVDHRDEIKELQWKNATFKTQYKKFGTEIANASGDLAKTLSEGQGDLRLLIMQNELRVKALKFQIEESSRSQQIAVEQIDLQANKSDLLVRQVDESNSLSVSLKALMHFESSAPLFETTAATRKFTNALDVQKHRISSEALRTAESSNPDIALYNLQSRVHLMSLEVKLLRRELEERREHDTE